MANKTITFTVGPASGGRAVTPASRQDAGVQGDHNEVEIKFILPSDGVTGRDFYIEWVSVTGTLDTTGKLEVVTAPGGNYVSFPLPRSWTQYGGQAQARLVAISQTPNPLTGLADAWYSEYAGLYFASRSGTTAEQTLISKTVQKAIEEAGELAELSKSWAVGGTGTRAGEDTDNSKYYKNQAASQALDAAADASFAHNMAIEAESFCHGGTGERETEDTDNAKYYAEQAAASVVDAITSENAEGVDVGDDFKLKNDGGDITVEGVDVTVGKAGGHVLLKGEVELYSQGETDESVARVKYVDDSVEGAIKSENAVGTDTGNDFKLANAGGKTTIEGTEVILGKTGGDVTIKCEAQMYTGYQPLNDMDLATKKYVYDHDEELRGYIEDIEDVIPSAASSSNQLADKAYVDAHAGGGTWETAKTKAIDVGNDTVISNDTNGLTVGGYTKTDVSSGTEVNIEAPTVNIGKDDDSYTSEVNLIGDVKVDTMGSDDNSVATKKYVDDNAGGGGTWESTKTTAADTGNDTNITNATGELGIGAYGGVSVASPNGIRLDAPVISLDGLVSVEGSITVPTPTSNDNPAPKKYVDDADAVKEDKGKLTVGGTEYAVITSTTDAGTAGKITFVLDA